VNVWPCLIEDGRKKKDFSGLVRARAPFLLAALLGVHSCRAASLLRTKKSRSPRQFLQTQTRAAKTQKG
jgi:hypothetical protein